MVLFTICSITQIFLFGPPELKTTFGMSDRSVIRAYYLFDGTSMATAAYLMMSVFNVRFHKHWSFLGALMAAACFIAYLLFFTSSLVGAERVDDGIILGSTAPFTIIPRIIAYGILAIVIIALLNTYRNANSDQVQIRNFYALAAFLVYDINYIVGLYYAIPLIMALKGILFFIIILLTLQDVLRFDIREYTPRTAERLTSAKLRKVYRQYIKEDIGHKEAVTEMEKALVEYKLNKISGFNATKASSLPAIAKSMKVSRSGLYDILKRLNIARPERD